MKKLIILLFLFISCASFGQVSSVTLQVKGGNGVNIMPYTWTGKTSPDTLGNLKFLRANYLQLKSFTDSLNAHSTFFSNQFGGLGTSANPIKLVDSLKLKNLILTNLTGRSPGDSVLVIHNNFVYKSASSGGGGTWGSITGTLSAQTDLQSALNAKLNITDTTAMIANVVHLAKVETITGTKTFTKLLTVSLPSLGTANTNGFLLSNSTAALSSGATVQNSPVLAFSGQAWGTTSGTSQNVTSRIYESLNSSTVANSVLTFDVSVNGGGFQKLMTIDNFGDFSAYNTFFINKVNLGNTSADGIVFNNSTLSTSGAPIQKSTRSHYIGSVWNTTTTAAPNQFDWTEEATGTSSGTPSTELDWYSSLVTGTTPSFTKRMSLDNAGNLTVTMLSAATGVFSSVVNTPSLMTFASNATLSIQTSKTYNAANTAVTMLGGSVTNSTGQFNGVAIQPAYTQTSTAAATDLLINRTETSVGSGAQLFISAQVGGSTKFSVDRTGVINSQALTASKPIFTDASKNLTNTGPGTSLQYIDGTGALQTTPTGNLTAANFVFNEVPSGTINGSNVTFALANTPTTGKVSLFKNGLLLTPTTDYSISGSTITFVVAPSNTGYSDVLLANYLK